MRIAILVYCLEGGGVQRQTLTLARYFHAHGHDVDYVVVRREGELRAAVPAGVGVVELLPAREQPTKSNTTDQIRAFPALVRYFRRMRPDAALAGGTHINLLTLLAHGFAGAHGRLILRLTSHMSRSKTGPHIPRKISLLIAAFFYRRAHRVVAVSEDVRQDFLRSTSFDPRRLSMIREPVITPAIAELAAAPPQHPWLEDANLPVILGVGRLSREKDFETLVRAFARVRKEHNARLVIIGAGTTSDYAGMLTALAAQFGVSGDIDFAGYVMNPYAFIARAKVFALSSQWEGCPNVVIEALYLGRQVVATDCPGGVREVLELAGAGRLVPARDPEAMAAGLIAGLDDRIARLARGTCPPGFAAQNSADQYAALFADPVARGT